MKLSAPARPTHGNGGSIQILMVSCRRPLDQAWSKLTPVCRCCTAISDAAGELGLDPIVKAYAQISAISEAFKVLKQGVIDKEQQDQIRMIEVTLDQLEGGTPNVIDA